MTVKPWTPAALCFAVVCAGSAFAGSAFAQSPDRVAAHTDWSVFVAASPKECYIVSPPKSSAATRDGKPAEVQRGDVRLFVAFRPGENVTNEVSFTGGYPFREGSNVTLTVGGQSFALVPGAGEAGEWAWTSPSDDSQVVAALKRGASATLVGTSSRGTRTEDTFSLSGFTAAVEDAAARCR
ncbi:MAG TPA: invasion associated locus B family protein [Amaricoccus sp.]|uniref:invasion associated locus B family protein n=1 Tax=Amaricoccus sp. TaxID=1872485 RepID=UPI002B93B396|nr:invasion associated locus B family protein [Amaricoccus sp.]HRO12941.1 invasion associated locus B family protein [Amaricoccus sp.]